MRLYFALWPAEGFADRVPLPGSPLKLTKDGAVVEANPYWAQRLRHGEVVGSAPMELEQAKAAHLAQDGRSDAPGKSPKPSKSDKANEADKDEPK